MKTFYIAASSQRDSRDAVSQLAKLLFQQFGWGWHANYDWTKGFQEEHNYPQHELLWRAQMDRHGALECDVFIFLETATPSLGANREYGVRWGANKKIYRLSSEPDHLFDMLDSVITIPEIDDLLKVLYQREL
jgi:hypothetical protein